jgi:hypothetical protein
MQQEEEKFELKPTVSESDKEFRAKVGEETWNRMKSTAFRNDGYKCQGCGFEPYDVEPDKVLDIHLVKENEESPEDSEVRTTCLFCHMIEHADAAVSGGYVELVNSHFGQGELVNICRNGALSYHIECNDIRRLKKTLPEYLEELKSGRALEGKVKLIFTEKFLQGLKS